MKEDFILKVIEKFEKGDAVVLQIKQDDCELILKKKEPFLKRKLPFSQVRAEEFRPPIL